MSLLRLNVGLLVLMLLLLAGAWLLQRDPQERNLELLPDMQYSPAYGAYSPNPNFANGQTLQPQPAGTIARGQLVLHFDATPEDAVRAGEELESPLEEIDEQVLAAGQETYGIYCALCHGPQGLGDGPVAKRGYPPPPSLLTGKSAQMKDGQLFHILTYGQGTMAPYASQLSPDDRWRVIAFVRDMQAQAAPADAGDNAESETDAPPNDEPQE